MRESKLALGWERDVVRRDADGRGNIKIQGIRSVSNQGPLFCSDNALSAALKTRALHTLSSQISHISVHDASRTAEDITFVVDAYPRDCCQLIISTPRDYKGEHPGFAVGEPLQIFWSEEGYSLGAEARVTADLLADKQRRAYAIRIDGPIYRQQRRDAFRVSVEPNDELVALLLVAEIEQPLPLLIEDLSIKGVRGTVASEHVSEARLQQGEEVSLAITFEANGKQFQPTVRLVSIKHLTAQRAAIGMQWLEPTTTFISHLRRFAAHKERVLLRRRSGLYCP